MDQTMDVGPSLKASILLLLLLLLREDIEELIIIIKDMEVVLIQPVI